ncbi:MAG: GNAT family N-acetyltransferase [Dehalococcoidia bacterium]|nr:GNAT family N-acetyltransferase [Dehalococcoidia bacterium]
MTTDMVAGVGAATIRPYDRQRHGDAAWRIVAAVFDEYGWEFENDDYDGDVREPDRWYIAPGGGFAIAEDEGGRPVGCVGYTDEGGGVFELHRLYVLAEARRSGAGSALVRWVIDEVRAAGARKLVLFSDTAFLDAHRLYLRFGFRNTRFRYADDPWRSPEWGFELTLKEDC